MPSQTHSSILPVLALGALVVSFPFLTGAAENNAKASASQTAPKTKTSGARPPSQTVTPPKAPTQKDSAPKTGNSPSPAPENQAAAKTETQQPGGESKKASLALPSTIRIFVTRNFPWGVGNETTTFSATETSGQVDAKPLSISVDPLTDKSDGRILKADIGGTIDGRPFAGSDVGLVHGKTVPVEIRITNAREVGLAETKLVFRSPHLSGESVIKFEAVIRDHWFWALLAVLLGTLFSYLALDWESVRRPILLLKIEAERIEEAARLLQRQYPGKAQALEEVYKILRDARHFIDLLDEAKAKEQVDKAQNKLNEISAPVQAAGPVTIPFKSALNYRLLQNPLQNLKSLITAPTEDLMIRRIRIYDRLLPLLAVLIVTLLGLQAVYQNQPFGGWDYGKAFLWGFGIDQTVKGFGPVLNKLRGR